MMTFLLFGFLPQTFPLLLPPPLSQIIFEERKVARSERVCFGE